MCMLNEDRILWYIRRGMKRSLNIKYQLILKNWIFVSSHEMWEVIMKTNDFKSMVKIQPDELGIIYASYLFCSVFGPYLFPHHPPSIHPSIRTPFGACMTHPPSSHGAPNHHHMCKPTDKCFFEFSPNFPIVMHYLIAVCQWKTKIVSQL